MRGLLNSIVLIAAASSLGGCSFLSIGEPDYGCKGMPEGVTCMSARDVYSATESDSFRKRVGPDESLPNAEPQSGKTEVAVHQPVAGERYVIPKAAQQPLPIRSQATVMRIWVAPWEGKDGDLNVPGYVYTEIEPRRWELGNPSPKVTPTLRPLQIQHPVAQTTPDTKNPLGVSP